MTSEPAVTIRLDGNGRGFRPGEALAGEYVCENLLPGDLKAVEVSVLWYTEGKGDEDMVVHAFWRFSIEEGDALDPRRPTRFETTLPHSPLSYEGYLLKIRWCVRVRVFVHRGKDLFAEQRFWLGTVPAVDRENDR